MDTPAFVSAALRYPDAELLGERRALADEARLLAPTPAVEALTRFLDWWADQPGHDLAHHYVETFDFARRTSLDLTYYTYGDRRQRGLALVDLRRRYAAARLEFEGDELPDHLPVVLEFAAAAPEEGAELLADFRPVIELLRMGLERAGSPWAGALQALCLELPALTDAEREDLRRMALEGPPSESVGLEPFAPPEVMPPSRAGVAAGCGAAVGGGYR